MRPTPKRSRPPRWKSPPPLPRPRAKSVPPGPPAAREARPGPLAERERDEDGQVRGFGGDAPAFLLRAAPRVRSDD